MGKRKALYFLLFIIMLSWSCNRQVPSGPKSEGVIEYDITYKKNDLTNIPEAMMPQKMVLYFTNRFTKNVIEGYAGVISIKNINDLKKDTVTTVLKFLGHKVFYTSKPREVPCCFEILEKPEITFLPDTTTIAEMLCNKARIFDPASNTEHSVYYTNEISAHNPNKNTSYEKIPGVLMEFEMTMGKITMHFKAKEVAFKPVDMKEFKLNKGYKKISRKEMVKIIGQLLE